MKRPAKSKPKPVAEPPTDDLLRSEGWRIYSRPKSGENLWQRRGVVLSQDKALVIARREASERREIEESFRETE